MSNLLRPRGGSKRLHTIRGRDSCFQRDIIVLSGAGHRVSLVPIVDEVVSRALTLLCISGISSEVSLQM